MASLMYVFLPALLMGAAALDEMGVALESDDQCDGSDSDCSVKLLQLRAHKAQENVSADAWMGSCRYYKCANQYRAGLCQCDPGCEQRGDCCSDYMQVCVGGCQYYSCGASFAKSHACQCNTGCASHGNCCPDYEATCLHMGSPAAQPADSGLYAPPSAGGDGYYGPPSQGGAGYYGPSSPGGDGYYGSPSPVFGAPYAPPTSHHATVSPVAGHPIPGKHYPSYPNFTLALVEEFEEPIDLDTDPIWTWSDGGLIEGQIRFVKEGITFSGGTMRIEVAMVDHSIHTESCSHAEVAEIKTKDMTSGEMRTKHNMFRYGRYEASIRAPMVQPNNPTINGNYISTMFVFRDAKYKHWREIDVEITGDHPDSLTTNVLSAENTTRWSADIAESKGFRVHKNLRSGFHTYAFEWLPHRIAWYFDGKLIREKTGGHVPISDKSAKIMMNLWIFDERYLFGGTDGYNNRFPMHSEYDWFRFYKWDQDHNYPCPGFDTSCLTPDDMYLSSNNPCDGVRQQGTVYGKAPCHATCHR